MVVCRIAKRELENGEAWGGGRAVFRCASCWVGLEMHECLREGRGRGGESGWMRCEVVIQVSGMRWSASRVY